MIIQYDNHGYTIEIHSKLSRRIPYPDQLQIKYLDLPFFFQSVLEIHTTKYRRGSNGIDNNHWLNSKLFEFRCRMVEERIAELRNMKPGEMKYSRTNYRSEVLKYKQPSGSLRMPLSSRKQVMAALETDEHARRADTDDMMVGLPEADRAAAREVEKLRREKWGQAHGVSSLNLN
jgi:hypothetical protein